MKWRSRKRKRALAIVAAALVCAIVAARVVLPYFLTSYANSVLRDIPDFHGAVDRIDVGLFRGAMLASGFTLERESGLGTLVAASADTLDVSIQWSALLRGRLVGKAALKKPRLWFEQVAEVDEQLAEDLHWTKRMAELMPIEINRFEIEDGQIDFARVEDDEVGDLSLKSLHLVATNISNVENEKTPLPSEFEFTARVFDLVPIQSRGRINLMQEIPSMEAELSCEEIALADLNDFAEQFLNLTFHKGTLSIYTEWAIADANIEGYLKFLGHDIEILDLDKEYENPLRFLWEAVAGLIVQSVKNQRQDQIATRVPFSGEIESVDTDTLSAIAALLRNAFIEALSPGVEGSIEFGSGKSDEDDTEE